MTERKSENEWTEGWRIVLGCALASGTGIALLFFTFNMFVLPLAAELKVSRGAIGTIQALIATAALGSVVMGRAADRFGFKPVYLTCAAIMIAVEVLIALFATSFLQMAIGVAVLGFFGIGTNVVVVTRPVSAHFSRYRGRALGLVAVGASISTFLGPPVLQVVLENYGWRGGYLLQAGLALAIGVPAAAFLVPNKASHAAVRPVVHKTGDRSFLRDRDFLLMAAAMIVLGLGTAGFVGQLSPMIQQEGLSAATGALALSLFAVGQFLGRLGGGWMLDHFEPSRIAVFLTIMPGSGFLVLLLFDHSMFAALLAAGMIGLQQGAELDVFAYFVARRFPVAQYGAIYGALHGLGWIGNAISILGVGRIHDATGSYDLAQLIGLAAMAVGACLIWLIRLSPPASPGSADPAPHEPAGY